MSTRLGKRVRFARLHRGITQAELARKAGITQAGIARIESGLSARPDCIEQLAKALSVRTEWLMFGIAGSPLKRNLAVSSSSPAFRWRKWPT